MSARRLLRLWFGLSEPVSRRAYALSGFGLMGLKYVTEAVLIHYVTGRWLTPLDYGNPLISSRRAAIGSRVRVESVEGLLAEDRESERSGDPLPAAAETYLPMIAAFGVEHGLARRASVAFHSLAIPQRRLLRGIVQDGKSFAELARPLDRPLAEIRAELRAAVESLEHTIGARLAERLGGGDRG